MIVADEALSAMPVSDALSALKAAGVLDKTLVVCAALNVERTTAYLKAGVKDVVLKPYTVGELAAMLK